MTSTAPAIAGPGAEPERPWAVEARGIVRRYGERVALAGLDLDVPRGCVFGLLGPNGSGKSTFISMLAAMEPPAEGSLTVLGEAPRPGLRARAGTVFQENAQDPLMTVGETLSLSGRLFGMSRGAIRERSAALLEAVGLAERAKSPLATLSGGMRRRFELVRALLHDPELLLLDEPTTGIDPGERRAFWDLVLGHERGHRTVLLATNDLAEADGVCERVAFIRDGAVVAAGTPEELKRGLRAEAVVVTWPGATEDDLARVASLAGAGAVTVDSETVHITSDDAGALVPALFALGGRAITGVTIKPATLEDAYFQHVGHERRGE